MNGFYYMTAARQPRGDAEGLNQQAAENDGK